MENKNATPILSTANNTSIIQQHQLIDINLLSNSI